MLKQPFDGAGRPISQEQGLRLGRRQALQGLAAGSVALGAGLYGDRADAAGPAPKRGGNLRLGMTGGGSSDTVAADNTVTQLDNPRILMLYEPLVSVNRNAVVTNILASSMEPDKTARSWTIRLKPGVTRTIGGRACPIWIRSP